MSGDPDQQYFSDGITEDIITELSKFKFLFVVARNSSFVFRGKPVDVAEIGRRLGVQYIVEGSVRRGGDRIRITTQLIDTVSGTHLWASRYDRELKDEFAVQDEVAHTVASTLVGRVEFDAMGLARRKPTENLTAYDCYLRGVEHHQRFTDQDLENAREMFERAIALDPEFAAPYAWLTFVYMTDYFDTGSKQSWERGFAVARKAVTLDHSDCRAHVALGYAYLQNRQFERAEAHMIQATQLNPNEGHAAAHMSDLYSHMGRSDDALDWIDKAIRLNPLHPEWYDAFRAQAFYIARRYSDGAETVSRLTTTEYWAHAVGAACCAMAGMTTEAVHHAKEVLARRPRFSALTSVQLEPFMNEKDASHLLAGLLKAGLPE